MPKKHHLSAFCFKSLISQRSVDSLISYEQQYDGIHFKQPTFFLAKLYIY